MAGAALKSRRRWQICVFGLGLSLSASVTQPGEAQTLVAVGQNLAQQKMGQSISNFCPSLVAQLNKTPGETNLATLCSNLGGNGGVNMFGLDQAGLNAALQQLNGGAELLVPTSQASVLETTQTSRQTSVVEARLSRERDLMVATAMPGGDFPRIGQLAALNPQEPGGQILLAQNQAPEFGYATGPLGVYATGLGQFGSRDPTTSENAYSFNNAGFVVGADYRFTPQLVAGLAFGYTLTNTSFDTSAVSASGQFLHDNLLEGNLYASYAFTDALYMTAIALVGGGNNNSQRHVVIPSAGTATPVNSIATGSFGSQVQGVTVASGYVVPIGPLVVTPIVRFFYQHTGVDGFSENTTQAVNLRYGSSRVNTVVSSLGADAQYTISTPYGPLYPSARFHWAHQYSPGNTAVSPTFTNDSTQLSTLILPGTPTSTDYFDIGAGVGLQLSNSSSAFINYDSIFGIAHTTYHSFTAGVRFTF
jgi:outer membrane autotransporter protein